MSGVEGRMVAFDARTLGYPGIGRYVAELVPELLRQSDADRFLFLAPPDAGWRLLGSGADRLRAITAPIYSLSEQIEMPRAARGAALFHAPHFNAPFFWKEKLVVTLHDLIYLRHPESLHSASKRAAARFLIGMACKKADAIIAVSAHTKKDILEEFPRTEASKIHVIHEAASPRFSRPPEEELKRVKEKYGFDAPFVLFVGTLKPHKGVEVLLEAMHLFRKDRGASHELVLAGRPDPKHPRVTRAIAEKSFARTVDEVPDADLPALYALADVFVLPSFYEGFGLPILEAMACGTPVVASSASSLPEVAGDAALYFRPGQVDALAELLYTVIQSGNLREKMVQNGLLQAQRFSWKRAASNTLKVYEQVLS